MLRKMITELLKANDNVCKEQKSADLLQKCWDNCIPVLYAGSDDYNNPKKTKDGFTPKNFGF